MDSIRESDYYAKWNEYIYDEEDIKMIIFLLQKYIRELDSHTYESNEKLIKLKSLIDEIIAKLEDLKIKISDEGIEKTGLTENHHILGLAKNPHAEVLDFDDIRSFKTIIESYIHEKPLNDSDERIGFLGTVLKTLRDVQEELKAKIELVSQKEEEKGMEPGD